MSKGYSIQASPLKMDFKIDLSLFCQNVKNNFAVIWQIISKNKQQIQSLQSQVTAHEVSLQQRQRKPSRSSNRKMSKNFSLNLSQLSLSPQGPKTPELPNPEYAQLQSQAQDKQILQINSAPKQLSQQKQIGEGVRKEGLQPNTDANVNENIKQNRAPLSQDQFMKMMESKVYEMNQRLERLQLMSIRESGTMSKKINQIYNQIEKNTQALTKRQGQLKKLQHYTQKLRGQLSQFKLKKQAQLLKMSANASNSSNSQNNSSSNSNSYIDLVISKIQQISNTLPQLLLKQQFEDYRAEMKPILGKLERKINDAVTSEEFNGLVGVLGRRKGDGIVGIGGKLGGGVVRQGGGGRGKALIESVEQSLEEIDPIVQFRLNTLQNQLKQTKQQLLQSKQQTQQKIQKTSQKHKQLFQKLQQLHKQLSRSQQKSSQHEQYLKSMSQSYGQKIKQIISQIVETQQSLEKLSNQMKFYNYTKSDTNVASGPTTNSSHQMIQGGKIIDLQNQVSAMKKKVNKITLKYQNIKQQILGVRQDFAREMEAIKAGLEKKCDWESLKKGMHYFEERVKELTTYVESLQKNIGATDDNGESTAAKRGWTCLCCDKDIKHYQGKLGQIKFTSIFPSRYQSPRIGGYYKQKQTDKEYKQVFLKHNRRLSQNAKSKEEIVL